MLTSKPFVGSARKWLRVVAGITFVALLGAACAQGGGESSVLVAPKAQAGHAALEGHDTSSFGQVAGKTTDGATTLRQTLTAALLEHEYLAGIAVVFGLGKGLESAEFKAAAATLDANSVALSEAVASVYGKAAGDAFLPLWRKHIGFFVDYAKGKATNDAALANKAKSDLDSYRADFGAFLASANPNLTKDAVAKALVPHVNSTFAAIDAVAAKDGTGFEKLRVAAGHMPGIAAVLAGAIAKQFPDKFSGTSNSAAADLLAALTAALLEHEYLAGIAVVQGVVTGKTDSPEFKAAAEALDKNSGGLSEAVASVYGKGAGDAFLPLWRKHIGFFVNYTVGKLTNDQVAADKAKADLDGYRADFGAFLASANPKLTKDAVAQALVPHVNSTFEAIDAVVAALKPAGTQQKLITPQASPSAFDKLRTAAGHMPGIATVLAGAIAAQFPDRFPASAPVADSTLARTS